MKSTVELREAEEFLHAHIPLTRAMGVRVVPHQSGFAIEAPVTLNYNHLQTAFGGSINSVATLAGYTFLWLEIRDRAAHLVVMKSSIRFLRPIRDRIQAVCLVPNGEEIAAFRAALGQVGKARIALDVRVREGADVAACFRGTFVGLKHSAELVRDRSNLKRADE